MPGKKDEKNYKGLSELIEWGRFDKMDPNDPLVRQFLEGRPYSSRDTIGLAMIPDLQKLR